MRTAKITTTYAYVIFSLPLRAGNTFVSSNITLCFIFGWQKVIKGFRKWCVATEYPCMGDAMSKFGCPGRTFHVWNRIEEKNKLRSSKSREPDASFALLIPSCCKSGAQIVWGFRQKVRKHVRRIPSFVSCHKQTRAETAMEINF